MPVARELSACQQSLWLLHKLAPASAAYNDGDAARISPAPDEAALRQAVRAVAARHDMLRSLFTDASGAPVRLVCDPDLVELDVREVPAVTDDELYALARQAVAAPFRLAESGPFRVVLLHRGRDAVLVIAAHHIATDAASQYLIWRDIFDAYQAFATGREPDWPALPAGYDDYVARERRLLDSPAGLRMAQYWRGACAGGTAAELPLDRPRPQSPAFTGATCRRQLTDELTTQLRATSLALGVTPFGYLLGAFQTLLYRYTGQPDLIIGCPASTRRSRAMRDVVGLFVNPIPLRAQFTPRTTFVDAVRSAGQQLTGGLARISYPSALLNGIPADRTPLFRIAFTMISPDRNNPLPDLVTAGTAIEICGHQVTFLDTPHLEGQFDLSVEITNTTSALTAVFRYDTELFQASTIERLTDRFMRVIAAGCGRPGWRVTQIRLTDDTDQQQTLAMGTGAINIPRAHANAHNPA
ncbi:MAG: hypothetical protein JO345_16210 [Streptosporangiaceae bacterium]|nr:hypothetical protein [Streptosporangiaceae bacterium]